MFKPEIYKDQTKKMWKIMQINNQSHYNRDRKTKFPN